MPKGPYLTPQIKKLIADIYIEDCNVGPTEARKELLERMKAKDLDKYFGSEYPSVSAVSKELKELRKKDEARSTRAKGLDEPWWLLRLATYDISPEAIPYIIRIQTAQIEVGFTLTIREARWIAWLSHLVDTPKLRRKLGVDIVDYVLMALARRYARSERIYELLSETGHLPDTETETWLFLHEDSLLYASVTGDNKPLHAAAKKLAEIDPEAYRAITAQDAIPPEEQYENLIEALEKEAKDARINKAKRQR